MPEEWAHAHLVHPHFKARAATLGSWRRRLHDPEPLSEEDRAGLRETLDDFEGCLVLADEIFATSMVRFVEALRAHGHRADVEVCPICGLRFDFSSGSET